MMNYIYVYILSIPFLFFLFYFWAKYVDRIYIREKWYRYGLILNKMLNKYGFLKYNVIPIIGTTSEMISGLTNGITMGNRFRIYEVSEKITQTDNKVYNTEYCQTDKLEYDDDIYNFESDNEINSDGKIKNELSENCEKDDYLDNPEIFDFVKCTAQMPKYEREYDTISHYNLIDLDDHKENTSDNQDIDIKSDVIEHQLNVNTYDLFKTISDDDENNSEPYMFNDHDTHENFEHQKNAQKHPEHQENANEYLENANQYDDNKKLKDISKVMNFKNKSKRIVIRKKS